MNSEKEIRELLELRKKIFLVGYRGKMAHLASSYSCLEMIYAFYIKGILKIDKKNSKWQDRDRFILSKGHAGLALYVVLEKAGLLSENTLKSYLQEGAKIGGEPCMRDCEWVEATTGSLGHGLSMGLGMALGLKLNKSSAKVFVILGDGELQEGVVWEAIMLAPKLGLYNLVAILDNNKIQKMDFIERTIGNPKWREKWKSFGWDVLECNGHDIEEFTHTIMSHAIEKRPRLIIANTIKGKGVSIMENNPNWHFKLPSKKELEVFKKELMLQDEELG